MRITLTRPTLPILYKADIVVVGGSFAGVAAAIALARAGQRVSLIESRTYVGREVTATLRPWIPRDASTDVQSLPEVIRDCIEAAGPVDGRGGEIPLHSDKVKIRLEDLLAAAGVKLVYASLPVGLCGEDDRAPGLIIGNKSGRQVITCDTIVDATETATVARLAGASFTRATERVIRVRRTLEFDKVSPSPPDCLKVPQDLGVVDHTVVIHRGYRGPEHVLVECVLDLPAGDGPADYARREIDARHRTMRLASYLVFHVAGFAQALLSTTSYELHGPQVSAMSGPVPDWALETTDRTVTLNDRNREPRAAALARFAGPVRGLWCLQEAARLDARWAQSLQDPVFAARVGSAFAHALVVYRQETAHETHPRGSLAGGSGLRSGESSRTQTTARERASALDVHDIDSPQRGRCYEQFPVTPVSVPLLRTVDVVVVGGGTSGAAAAMTSGGEGMRTLLIESNPGLGGTGTLGGVDSYWYGRDRVGFAARLTRLVDEVQRSINYHRPKWNIEAKMYALLRATEAAGVETIFPATSLGAVMDGNRVRGVIVATRWGLYAVLAEVVIDATGDGDVAVAAGADYTYGSDRDHAVMWYSLAQFATPGRTRNNFTSTVDVSNVEDYTRAILAGRRRGDNCHDHGIYMASRETRHIRGDTMLTLTDQLVHRRWPDVVNIHYSNHDIKGKSCTDWTRMGLIPPNLEVEIPYRVLLPAGLDGILVAGKAISATHDGFPAIRMQADLENLGGVVALAAAQAVRAGGVPREVAIPDLQRRLVESGLLPARILTRTLAPRHYTNDALAALVDSLTADKALYSYSDMDMGEVYEGSIPIVEICTVGARIIPYLEKALRGATGQRRVLLAQALATYGSSSGVPTLLREVERALSGDTLPARDSHIRHAGFPPDQDAMPDVVYLIYSLGMARDPRSVPVWVRVADRLNPTLDDIRDRVKGTFYYVDAVCVGAERLGDPAAIPCLMTLHSYPVLRDQVALHGYQSDVFPERQATLELTIARALARCGSPEGVRILASYLPDCRALLAEHAHSELVAITGLDLGKDAQAWKDWVGGAAGVLEAHPVQGGLETEYQGQTILREH